MHTTNIPGNNELPTSLRLIRSTALALATAAVLLIAAILPAEYGYDPTGTGEILGLTEMGRVKMALMQEMEAEKEMVKAMEAMPTETIEIPAEEPPVEDTTVEAAMPPEVPSETGTSAAAQDETRIMLAPGQTAEIKVVMMKGAAVSYRWQADSPVNVDVHGDPADAPKDFYHGYGKGKNITKSSGTIVAAFDGKHGWFWRNRSEKTVTLVLNTHGNYRKLKRIL